MDFIGKFEGYLEREKRVSKSTLSAYMADIQEFEDFLISRGKSLEKAVSADVAAFIMSLQHKGRSASTTNRKLASVRSFYEFMRADGRVKLNPAENIKAVKVERNKLEYLSEDEIMLLLEAPDDSDRGIRDRALFEFMYASGIRVSELCYTDVGHLNMKIGYVNVFHGEKARVVPIGKPAKQALKAYLTGPRGRLLGDKEDDGALFLSYLGERITRQGVWKLMKLYGEKTGLKDRLTPQIIRNTFAAHMVQNGADLKSIQDLLGHEDITATKIYLSVTKNRILDVYDRTFPRAK